MAMEKTPANMVGAGGLRCVCVNYTGCHALDADGFSAFIRARWWRHNMIPFVQRGSMLFGFLLCLRRPVYRHDCVCRFDIVAVVGWPNYPDKIRRVWRSCERVYQPHVNAPTVPIPYQRPGAYAVARQNAACRQGARVRCNMVRPVGAYGRRTSCVPGLHHTAICSRCAAMR